MATRRRTTVVKTEEKKAPPVVTQVVEEIKEEVEEVIDDIKQDAKDIEKTAEKLEDTIVNETPAPSIKETIEEEVTPAEKKIVDELFSGGPAAIDGGIRQESPAKSLALWAIVVLIIAVATGSILIFAVKGGSKLPIIAQPTPTLTPTPTPTPMPAAVNRSDITVQVLNGGGVVGSGAKMKAFLEEKGYKVSDVKNADEFTFQETEIHVKDGKEAYLDLLKTDLAEKYTAGTTAADLASDSSSDAQVIVGKK